MGRYGLTVEEVRQIKNALENKLQELDSLVLRVSKVISEVTNYTTVAVTPKVSINSIRNLQLIPVDEDNILLVLITDSGMIKNTIIKLRNNFNKNQINYL